MPIKVSCKCGKKLSAPDAAAGKAVKCPGCGKGLRVPGAGQQETKAKPAAVRPQAQPVASAADDIGSLFDEEGFTSKVESVCPNCRVEMAGTAVLCTKCGYNKETGMQLESHKTAGVDIDHGTLALERAADDMVKEKEMQKKLVAGGGMPWWGLILVMVIGGGTLGLAVLAVNRANQEIEYDGPGLMSSILMLVGGTLSFASVALILNVAFLAFMRRGFIKTLVLAVVLGVVGGSALYRGIETSDDVAEPEDSSGLKTVM